MLKNILNRFWVKHSEFEGQYIIYTRMRGFNSFNDLPFHRRGFIECWAEPGIHRFWQVWNPGISHLVYRLFIKLGGLRNWKSAVFLSFIICGFIHTIIVAPFLGRWSYSVITAFACFGLLVIFSKLLSPYLKQEKWPVFINVIINLAHVIVSFDIGFKLDLILC